MIDFDGMVQSRRNSPSRKRRIKRDLSTIPKKGIAGIRIDGQHPQDKSSGDQCASTSRTVPASPSPTPTPAPPTNTPQTPHTPSVSGESSPDPVVEPDGDSLQRAMEEIRRLSLQHESWSSRELDEESLSEVLLETDDDDVTETSSAIVYSSALQDSEVKVRREK